MYYTTVRVARLMVVPISFRNLRNQLQVGWMMWNWLLSALASGATVVLYDGSPFVPNHDLSWRLVDELKITVLGTSAKMLAMLEERDSKPATHGGYSLNSLRCILSTGSPLAPRSFDYVYCRVKSDVLLGSITGGSDIIACFAGSNPALPVRRGEIQAPILGMAIQCWTQDGRSVQNEDGELVCVKPFPSQPIGFWNDAQLSKYRAAYFQRFPSQGVWAHGDYVRFSRSSPPGLVMLGRCDGTLNPCGVRFGSAEIYSVVEAMNEVADSLCVGQYSPTSLEERVILFIVMATGSTFSREFADIVKHTIRVQLSPRHVPSIVLPCTDIPVSAI